jgi:hypothetical protein
MYVQRWLFSCKSKEFYLNKLSGLFFGAVFLLKVAEEVDKGVDWDNPGSVKREKNVSLF